MVIVHSKHDKRSRKRLTNHIPCHILSSAKLQEQYSPVFPQLKMPFKKWETNQRALSSVVANLPHKLINRQYRW